MAGYTLLRGLRIIEVAQLGPASLGGYLADMGAEVIKVEGLEGDPVRDRGSPALGSPHGLGLLHLRWNRGKKSIGVDLKSAAGAALFRRLVSSADVLIEGMRGGVLERLGLGFDTLRASNRKLVFCSISGLGLSGPYHRLGSHGPSFDAFGALSSINPYALTPEEQQRSQVTPVGMHAMGLHAALGVLAAVIQAQRSGAGAQIEVAAAESAAHWRPDAVDSVLNEAHTHVRPGFLGGQGRMACWPRLCRYDTRDGRGVFFQALSPKFWTRFCAAIGRKDLEERYDAPRDVNDIDEQVHVELTALFATRTLAAWMALFLEHDVPGCPANTVRELASDPHFLARENIYEVELPGTGTLRLTSTPVKVAGQQFAPDLAPGLGQHTEEVLRSVLGLDAREIADLQATGAVFGLATAR